MPFKFLLDQNFPSPLVDVEAADRSVRYVALSDFDRTLTIKGTPDWLIYLRAAEEDLTGVVTRDASQLQDAEELVCLLATQLAVVTWDQPIEDPITEWGQLLAYMPQVVRRIARDGPSVFTLPRPQLSKRNVGKARALLGELASRQGVSFPEMRDGALRRMRAELDRRSLPRLGRVLDSRRGTA